MQLSIIIVNYNVKYFLEQCLCSVKDAITKMDAEVIVVDNNSGDDSVTYLRQRFPWACFIQNHENLGFAKANNQAYENAKGSYILFLNPDTLIPEHSLQECLEFMGMHHEAGALGIKMIDGSGHFLPESKRAFPSPFTSLFKLVGLASLFPKSGIFGRYHLGHLSPADNHEVDVLAGAFLLVRKKVIEQVGCFDETFFMYGEDVDLSYRIQAAGWKNYYFAGTTIIHFKGESTKKGSLNYVRMFYQAMSLFVKKHYSTGKAGFFRIFIQLAIWLRAALSALARFLKWMGLPLADILITISCLALIALFWGKIVKPGLKYQQEVMLVVLPLFTLTFIIAGWVAGLYDKWYRPRRAWYAMVGAVIVSLAVYSLLDINYRFSRGVIFFGGVLAAAAILLFRHLLVISQLLVTDDEQHEISQTLIAGNVSAYKAAIDLMEKEGRNERVLGRIGLNELEPNTIGSFNQLEKLLGALPAREVVFCIGKDLPLSAVMAFIQKEKRKIRYKFFYENSGSIIGSSSKETSGESWSAAERFLIDSAACRRMKKINDIGWAVFLLIGFPINVFIVKKPVGLLGNIIKVLAGKRTWVSYCTDGKQLPAISRGIIGSNAQPIDAQTLGYESLYAIDYWYAKDYDWQNDTRLIMRAYRFLGN